MRVEGKAKIGRVVGDKMDKTVVVAVESVRMHRLYQKPVKRTRKFKAHDAANSCKVGDLVRIVESRPLSKEKRWRVTAILKKSETIQVEV
ncbi:MAG: 30S ribosomal protein S17 [Chloroflexota bacterium]